MYNTLQPLINLTNSNLQAFSRFGKSNEISEITKESMQKLVEIETGSFRQIFNSAAYRDLAQAFWSNYKRFATECVQGITNVSDTARRTLDSQLEVAKKPMQTIADAASRTVRAGSDALEEASDTAANATRQVAGRAEKAVEASSRESQHQVNRDHTSQKAGNDVLEEDADSTAHTARQAAGKAEKAGADTSRATGSAAKAQDRDTEASGRDNQNTHQGNRDQTPQARTAK